jgi:hypothetical protein
MWMEKMIAALRNFSETPERTPGREMFSFPSPKPAQRHSRGGSGGFWGASGQAMP